MFTSSLTQTFVDSQLKTRISGVTKDANRPVDGVFLANELSFAQRTKIVPTPGDDRLVLLRNNARKLNGVTCVRNDIFRFDENFLRQTRRFDCEREGERETNPFDKESLEDRSLTESIGLDAVQNDAEDQKTSKPCRRHGDQEGTETRERKKTFDSRHRRATHRFHRKPWRTKKKGMSL